MVERRIVTAKELLARRRSFINGEFVTGGRPFDIVNPATGLPYAQALAADETIVDAAVVAARNAITGEWGRLPLADRTALMKQVADGIEARFDDFLQAEVADTGKPAKIASHVDIPRGAANFRVFADAIKSLSTECFEMDTPDGRGAINYARRRPVGVVAVVSPWNLPLLLMTWKVAPAMACGNAVVVKPSEQTPSTTTLLAEVIKDVGIPAGAFNVVHGFGANSAGQFLVSHPGIDAVTFTGSCATGSAIMHDTAKGVKEISFELGGKNPALVFADADLDKAIPELARAVFLNTGQVCLAPERVYVERSVFDQVVSGLKQHAEALVPGMPDDPATNLGPLISAQHRDKVLGYYRLAVEEGATVVTGGGIPEFGDERDRGFYIEPTIWIDLPETARTAREEVFGPACHVTPFDDEEEAIRLANDSEYGLASTIWTENLSRAHRVAGRIETGIVWVNSWFLRDLRTPFGGTKLSGIGREGGIHSLNFYSELSNVCIKL